MGFSLERLNEYLTALLVAMVHYTWLHYSALLVAVVIEPGSSLM